VKDIPLIDGDKAVVPNQPPLDVIAKQYARKAQASRSRPPIDMTFGTAAGGSPRAASAPRYYIGYNFTQ
jgi:hypothetical protein